MDEKCIYNNDCAFYFKLGTKQIDQCNEKAVGETALARCLLIGADRAIEIV